MLSTFNVRVEYISVRKIRHSAHSNQWRRKILKQPLPLGHVDPRIIHPSLDRSYLPNQRESRSIQPFCHSTLSGQTDRQTVRPTDRPTHRPTDGLGDRFVTWALTLSIHDKLFGKFAESLLIVARQGRYTLSPNLLSPGLCHGP